MKNLTLVTALLAVLMAFASCHQKEPSEATGPQWVLVIHGGAGTILRKDMTAEREKAYLDKLTEALETGAELLESGGKSLDAVTAAIRVMEDSPLFNAGKGAVFTAEGTNEMDAAIMDGSNLRAGAVAGLGHVKNPILAARLVMDSTGHVLLTGEGAEEFAEKHGLEMADSSYFFTPARYDSYRRASEKADKHGTVGAVALDLQGNLAAGTSTGGMTYKMKGRVGDSPVIGAGTYADNEGCAVSATGHGEYFIRYVVAHDICTLMKYGGLSLRQAAHRVIMEKLKAAGGTGGVIALDRAGNVAMPFNTAGMYRGVMRSGESPEVWIYGVN